MSIRARVRSGDGWADGHILNISSRGMMIQYTRPLTIGSTLEIRNEGRFVPVTVVWKEGFKAGLAAHGKIAVADWVEASCDQACSTGTATPLKFVERRNVERNEDEWRDVGRKLETVAVFAIASALALGVAAMAAKALIEPLQIAARTLS